MFLCFMCALSSSLDSFAVSVSYGVKKIKLPFLPLLIICIISTLGTFLPMKFGQIIIAFTGENIINYLGSLILIFIGTFFIYETLSSTDVVLKEVLSDPALVDYNNSGVIDLNEAVLLATALTVNNIAVGIASAVAGLSITYTTFFTFVVTFFSIKLGYYFGKNHVSKSFGEASQIFSGVLIILIGVIKIIVS